MASRLVLQRFNPDDVPYPDLGRWLGPWGPEGAGPLDRHSDWRRR